MLSGNARHIYYGTRIPMIDVFYDKLSYNHPIDYRWRLEIHPLCVSLTDLLLQKLQIVQINDKDLKDAMLLLLAASVSDIDVDKQRSSGNNHPKHYINIRYLCKLLSNDWGFYYTSTMNLAKVRAEVDNVGVLTEPQRMTIRGRVDEIVQHLEKTPKSGKWKGRAKVGIKKPWYNEVSDWS